MMEQKPELQQYIHLQKNDDISPLDRDYQATEGKLEYNGREVLYLISETTGFTCCDGSYSPRLETVNVIGYIGRWKYGVNDTGAAVSEIETIEDKKTRQEIKEILKKSPKSKLSCESKVIK